MNMDAQESKTIFSPFVLAIMVVVFALLFNIFTEKSLSYDQVTFLDVGQGDAALIQTHENQKILIDGGPSDSLITKLDKKIPFYQRTLDAVILSHPHADHFVGLQKIFKNYEVKNFYISGVIQTTPEYLDLLKEVKDKKINTKIVKAGDELVLDTDERISFLFPLSDISNQKYDNINNSSVVAKYIYGQKSILFMGDLEKEAQDILIKNSNNLKSDILKVPHHGSNDSANNDLIQTVLPEYAVISVGKDNKFGHPSKNALEILKSIKVFRTDNEGDITFQVSKTSINTAN